MFTRVATGIIFMLFAGQALTGSTASGKFRSVSAHDIQTVRIQNDATEVVYRLSTSRDVTMNLAGTTPIRNWKMSARGLNGEAKMVLADANQLSEIRSLNFALPVYNLKGDVRAMDEDAYTALKADRFKEITFALNSATVLPQAEGTYAIAARGTLTVAGVARKVTLKMRAQIGRDSSIHFSGSETIRMSDYNVERPSLLFGAVKAGDEMILTYNLIFTR